MTGGGGALRFFLYGRLAVPLTIPPFSTIVSCWFGDVFSLFSLSSSKGFVLLKLLWETEEVIRRWFRTGVTDALLYLGLPCETFWMVLRYDSFRLKTISLWVSFMEKIFVEFCLSIDTQEWTILFCNLHNSFLMMGSWYQLLSTYKVHFVQMQHPSYFQRLPSFFYTANRRYCNLSRTNNHYCYISVVEVDFQMFCWCRVSTTSSLTKMTWMPYKFVIKETEWK